MVRGRSGQSGIHRTGWIREGGERKVERGERLPDLGEYSKGSGAAGRRTELVGGCRQNTRRGKNLHSPCPSPFRSEPPPQDLFFKYSLNPRTLCIFYQIRGTISGQMEVSWQEGWPTGVCGRGLGGDKARPPGACEEEPADRGIQG